MRSIFILSVSTVGVAASALANPIELELPIACEIGRSCVVQQYVDDDPGPGARDYRCGTLTYNGHDGTDFRLPSMAAQRKGVDVRAAADGHVLRARDGMPDVSVKISDRAVTEARECGNGVVIAHEGGWETQYCHLAQGSLRVKPGDNLRAGETIGRVGLSGKTEFPHLHLTVRQDRRVVDPFAFGAAPGTCEGGASLWAPSVQASLAYRPRALLNTGFAPQPVTMESIEAGQAGEPADWAQAPVLVAFVRAVGLKKEDVQMLSITGPDGRLIAEHRGEPLDRNKAQTLLYAGLKRPEGGWHHGRYQARFAVLAGSDLVLEETFDIAF